MRQRRALTLVEFVLGLVVIAMLLLLIIPITLARREARRAGCRRNLSRLAKSLWAYPEHASHRYYPCPFGRVPTANDFNGAEWLASVYWVGMVVDPSIFICPGTHDTNRDGLDIGTHRAPPSFGSQTISYAGMHYRSQTNSSGAFTAGAIRDDFPPNMPMGCDDTQGSINHGTSQRGGMNVVFFDNRVEWKSHEQVNLETGVGQKPGLLWQLRN